VATARVDRTFDVDIATMWSLWTDPEHLARWFRPSLDDYGPTLASIDLRPGGAYRLEMVRSDGETHAVAGTVVAVEEPTRLALTWHWEGNEHESRVDVTLTARGARTTVVIDHSDLLDETDAARHAEGWVGCLASLAATG
jgi:uncharacterized protein YndB with AHSA1/START domain